ncbi:MAG TPA: helix-turn-helix domain-containing protein [Steroidobacteraceae bacterium]
MTRLRPTGELLRTWRERRRMSQLDLAGHADTSARHISFLETGRSMPSREMLLRLAERLEIPLRDRNALLVSAGYAPMYAQRSLDDPALQPARRAIELVLAGHEPYPAIAIDQHWTLVSANAAVAPMLIGVDQQLLVPPVNVLRLSLHPGGLAPRIENLAQWRAHLLERLRHQIELTADPTLAELLKEIESYPAAEGASAGALGSELEYEGVVVPLKLRTQAGVLSMFSTTTVFGTPLDITLAELAIESFFPADAQTAQALRQICSDAAASSAMQ